MTIPVKGIVVNDDKREIICTEVFTCVRCKDEFLISSTISNILSEEDFEQYKLRVKYHPNEAPFDTGSDMSLKTFRGMCGGCLQEEIEQ